VEPTADWVAEINYIVRLGVDREDPNPSYFRTSVIRSGIGLLS